MAVSKFSHHVESAIKTGEKVWSKQDSQWLIISTWMAVAIALVAVLYVVPMNGFIIKRSFKDESVSDYLTERICWWNEVCKEEFQTQFKCKCPTWSFCRSPGRYYNAFCSVAETGYIWSQPAANWGITVEGV